MGDFSLIGGSPRDIEYGFDATNVRGQSITAGAANVKGSYSDIVTAVNNTQGGSFLRVIVDTDRVADAAEFLLDIALGPATETIIVNNLYLCRCPTVAAASELYVYDIPINIPTGVRVSARIQSTTASALAFVYIKVMGKSFKGQSGLGVVTTYGADTASSSGTQVAHGTAGWGGSWVEITASTTLAMKGFFVARGRVPASWANGTFAMRLAVGGSGSEDSGIIYTADLAKSHANEGFGGGVSPFIPVSIPSGSRISIKVNAVANNTDFDFDFIVYGVS